MSVVKKGDIVWGDFGPALGSGPAGHRPAVVVQSNHLNRANLGTVVVAIMTSKTRLATYPGNVFAPATATGLPKDSVINATALATVDKSVVGEPVGRVPENLMKEVDASIRLVLDL